MDRQKIFGALLLAGVGGFFLYRRFTTPAAGSTASGALVAPSGAVSPKTAAIVANAASAPQVAKIIYISPPNAPPKGMTTLGKYQVPGGGVVTFYKAGNNYFQLRPSTGFYQFPPATALARMKGYAKVG
jgi:hypothetical protein